ncbi:MAG: hypothetical protein LBD24_06020, partial [Spirochaetaceae bacterium]|nr:hypothetical protein [Spirochaetaceae bacterium]
MDKIYSQESIESEDLHIFVDKAMDCFCSVKKNFEKSIKLVALCQGGGLHYAVTHGYIKTEVSYPGLKDIDIWFFFKKENGENDYDPKEILNCDLGISKFGRCPDEDKAYKGRRMDIIGRSIPFYADTPDVAVQQWLNLGWDCSGEYFQNYV